MAIETKAVTDMSIDFLRRIGANYRAGNLSPDRTLEALNALGFAASVILAGIPDRLTGPGRRDAREFLMEAIDGQVPLIIEAYASDNLEA